MPMTAPVISWYNTTNSVQTKVMCFFIGKQYQTNTPNPSSSDVFIMQLPTTTMATIRYYTFFTFNLNAKKNLFYLLNISFSGFATDRDYTNKQKELMTSLGTNANTTYDSQRMFMAGYDSPFKLFGRTNEVWLRKLVN
jgi:hypothetical protein